MDNYQENLKTLKADIKELEAHMKLAEKATLQDLSKEEKAVFNIMYKLGQDAFALNISTRNHLRTIRGRK